MCACQWKANVYTQPVGISWTTLCAKKLCARFGSTRLGALKRSPKSVPNFRTMTVRNFPLKWAALLARTRKDLGAQPAPMLPRRSATHIAVLATRSANFGARESGQHLSLRTSARSERPPDRPPPAPSADPPWPFSMTQLTQRGTEHNGLRNARYPGLVTARGTWRRGHSAATATANTFAARAVHLPSRRLRDATLGGFRPSAKALHERGEHTSGRSSPLGGAGSAKRERWTVESEVWGARDVRCAADAMAPCLLFVFDVAPHERWQPSSNTR